MKKLIIIILIFSSVSACNVLDIQPVSQILSDNFYTTGSNAEAALMSIYNRLHFSVADNLISAPSVMSDEAIMTRGGNFTRHHNFEPTPVQGNVGNVWQDYYQLIQRANDLIVNVPIIEDPAFNNRNQILGEAIFLRGLAHFILTRLFGDIPIVISPSTSGNQDFQIPKNPQSEVFEQIIADFQEAEELLSSSHPNRARVAKGTAKGYLVKLYTYRNGPGDREAALVKINEILSDGQYSLVPGENYESIFRVGQQNSSETLLEMSYRPNTGITGHQLEQETVPYPNNIPRVIPTQKLIDAYNENPDDLRYAVSLAFHNNIHYTRKYERNDVNEATRLPQATNIIFLRLSDLILLKAEILNEQGNVGQALEDLNLIRQRAGIPSYSGLTQQELRLAIEKERMLELSLEGHRWHDLVRTNRALELCAPRLTDPARILWPIPARDLDVNPNLSQNPSY
ncbi:RagB/SusD family nutrient uptake outer membrane protein [Aquiflexum sp.]|uniref:RagB/SusD family nutrient uptake outer membrane protein n=1 Tax=Aquiflexum sp. TaxID=1872584 RepID=UPI00359364E9